MWVIVCYSRNTVVNVVGPFKTHDEARYYGGKKYFALNYEGIMLSTPQQMP